MSFLDQSMFAARCDWGLHAIQQLAPSEAVVIVDVLSFTTTVEIAVSRGVHILPYRWRDASAITYAKEMSAELAGVRGHAGEGRYTLAPSSLINAPAGLRLVLPSPNGSTLAFEAASAGSVVVAGCLRNATALSAWLRSTFETVSVVPAGERWPDGTLRVAAEDLLGAGAILSGLAGPHSPEARLALAAFESAKSSLLETLLETSSGRELVARGFRRDVELAAELDVSSATPVLEHGSFENGRKT